MSISLDDADESLSKMVQAGLNQLLADVSVHKAVVE